MLRMTPRVRGWNFLKGRRRLVVSYNCFTCISSWSVSELFPLLSYDSLVFGYVFIYSQFDKKNSIAISRVFPKRGSVLPSSAGKKKSRSSTVNVGRICSVLAQRSNLSQGSQRIENKIALNWLYVICFVFFFLPSQQILTQTPRKNRKRTILINLISTLDWVGDQRRSVKLRSVC